MTEEHEAWSPQSWRREEGLQLQKCFHIFLRTPAMNIQEAAEETEYSPTTIRRYRDKLRELHISARIKLFMDLFERWDQGEISKYP